MVSDNVPVYVGAAGVSEPVSVDNGSFELDNDGEPNTVKRDLDEARSWSSGLDVGSGVETIAHPTDPSRDFTGTGDGLMKVYGKWDVDLQTGDWWYQLLDQEIAGGDQYTLTFAYGPSSSLTPVIASLIDADTMEELASVEVNTDVIRVFADYTLEFTVPGDAEYIGDDLGIEFRIGVRQSQWSGWASVDNVRLDYVPGLAVVQGDLTGDGEIDIDDLHELSEQWLWSGSAGERVEDISGDGKVDMVDFAMMAQVWLQ